MHYGNKTISLQTIYAKLHTKFKFCMHTRWNNSVLVTKDILDEKTTVEMVRDKNANFSNDLTSDIRVVNDMTKNCNLIINKPIPVQESVLFTFVYNGAHGMVVWNFIVLKPIDGVRNFGSIKIEKGWEFCEKRDFT